MAYQKAGQSDFWEVPYLPIDPTDVGRTYEDIIRINSQSGKGGIAYILENDYGYELPKAMHPEVGRLIQAETDRTGIEIDKERILEIFEKYYLICDESKIAFKKFKILSNGSSDKPLRCQITYIYKGKEIVETGEGNGPIDAVKQAVMKHFDQKIKIVSYHEHSRGTLSSAEAVAYINIETKMFDNFFGVGLDTDITVASIKALFSALRATMNKA